MNKNILIAGIGGQGVNTLSIAIQNTCIKQGLYCKSAIFKGGAQKRGAIYSFIRVFSEKNDRTKHFGGEIALGDLDVMIALEPQEAIRYMKYYNKETKILVNSDEVTFFAKRYQPNTKEISPSKVLEKRYKNTVISNFSEESKTFFKNRKMSNFIMGIQAIRKADLPIDEKIFTDEFIKTLRLTDLEITKIKAY